jgi:hypothetical protein
VAGKKRRTVLHAILEMHGINVETPECRNANQAVTGFSASRVEDMQEVNSGPNRRSMACESNIHWKQTAS